MRFICVLTLLIVSLITFSQNQEIKQLEKDILNAKGKTKLTLLNDLIKKYVSIDPQKGITTGNQALHLADSLRLPSAKSMLYNSTGVNYWAAADYVTARSYYAKALENARQFNDTMEIGVYYNRMGLLCERLGKFDSSLYYFNMELEVYRLLKNDERKCNVLENLGTIHLNRGEFRTSLKYLLEALTIAEQRKDIKKRTTITLKIGRIYAQTDEYSKAEKFYRDAIAMALSEKNMMSAALGYNALGILYKSQGRFNDALVEYHRATESMEGLQNKLLTHAIYHNTGNIYMRLENYSMSLKYLSMALEVALQMHSPVAIATLQVEMAGVFLKLKEYRKSLENLNKAIPVLQDNRNQLELMTAYDLMIDVSIALKDYEKSTKYLQIRSDLSDTLNRKELNRSLDSLKLVYHTEQTEKENLSLRTETELKNKTIRLQQFVILIICLLIVVLAFSTWFIIRSRKRVQQMNLSLDKVNKEIKAKVQELENANEKINDLSKFRDLMISFLVHDLKNALNFIINIDLQKDPELQTMIVRTSGRQMLTLVQNILDIGKLENSNLKLDSREVSSVKLLDKAFRHLQVLAGARNIRLGGYDTPGDHTLMADELILERVLINILDNAIRHSAVGSAVVVQKEVQGNLLKISVKDEGEGIDPKVIPHIFDKYASFSGQLKEKARTYGLGLAFCKMAVESHGGEIGVLSEPGRGTTIWFTIPLAGGKMTTEISPALQEETATMPELPVLTAGDAGYLRESGKKIRELSIYQMSDVKDILNTIDESRSGGIQGWKIAMTDALVNFNHKKFEQLLNHIENLNE